MARDYSVDIYEHIVKTYSCNRLQFNYNGLFPIVISYQEPLSRPPYERKQGVTSVLLSGSAAANAKNLPARSAVMHSSITQAYAL